MYPLDIILGLVMMTAEKIDKKYSENVFVFKILVEKLSIIVYNPCKKKKDR